MRNIVLTDTLINTYLFQYTVYIYLLKDWISIPTLLIIARPVNTPNILFSSSFIRVCCCCFLSLQYFAEDDDRCRHIHPQCWLCHLQARWWVASRVLSNLRVSSLRSSVRLGHHGLVSALFSAKMSMSPVTVFHSRAAPFWDTRQISGSRQSSQKSTCTFDFL